MVVVQVVQVVAVFLAGQDERATRSSGVLGSRLTDKQWPPETAIRGARRPFESASLELSLGIET